MPGLVLGAGAAAGIYGGYQLNEFLDDPLGYFSRDVDDDAPPVDVDRGPSRYGEEKSNALFVFGVIAAGIAVFYIAAKYKVL